MTTGEAEEIVRKGWLNGRPIDEIKESLGVPLGDIGGLGRMIFAMGLPLRNHKMELVAAPTPEQHALGSCPWVLPQ